MIVALRDARGDLGGKANGLRALADAHLPVPDAWVVPRSAFRAFLTHNGIQPGDAKAVRTGRFPTPLTSPAALVAVRSSAVTEDAARSANAGRFTTVLGVRPEALHDAVREVWASWMAAWTPGDPPDGMTVLIQPMVDARCSGVVFTINPVTGSWAELVIEAVWGLGEPLVAGQMVPDRYVLHRDRGLGSAARLSRGDEAIHAQPEALVLNRGKLLTQPTEAPLARKLLYDDVLALGALAMRVERARGEPQDIEWVIDRAGVMWVVQSRPITSPTRLPRGDATLWTRRFIGERFPSGVTPLTWSIVAPTLEYFISYPQTSRDFLGGDPPLRLTDGHPYLNVTVFRHLAFKAPGMAPPRFMLDFFPPEEEAAWTRRRAAAPDLRVYASIFATTFAERRWRRFRWNPLSNVAAWDTFAALNRSPDFSALSVDQTLSETQRLLTEYIKIHVTSLLFANMGFEAMTAILTPEQARLALRPFGGSITRQVDAELGQVGRGELSLDVLLSRHGHRSRASWEIWSERLADDPAGTAVLARSLAHQTLDLPAEAAQTAAALASLGRWSAPATLTAHYLRLREAQRYWLDLLFFRTKQRLTALAPSLGLSAPDLPYLTRAELCDLPHDAARRAEQRRALPLGRDMPDFMRGDVPTAPMGGGRRLQGLGVSPGTAQGTARVARTLAEAAGLRAGEILVAPSTDPAWTPLFARAGGLVLELGSQLSHGAVVAREYSLPAVANISQATQRIHDGDELFIDGRAGAVWIL